MKVDRDSWAFKLAITPFLLLFFNVPAILAGLDGIPGWPAYVPLLILNCIVFLDLFTRRHARNKDRFKRGLLVLSFLAFPIALAVPYLENDLLWGSFVPLPVLIPGTLIEASGGLLILYARKILGNYGSVDIVLEEDHALITEGPYKYVRNPMYSGFLLLLAGYSVALGGYVSSVVSSIFVFGVLHARTVLEEELLEARFGEEYRAYRKRSGRCLPRMTRRRADRESAR